VIKKIQLGLLSFSAVAILAACGGGNDEEMPPMDDQTEETQPQEDSQEGTQDGEIQDEITDEAADDSGSEDGTTSDQNEEAVDTSNGILNAEFPVALNQATQLFSDTFGANVNIDQVEFDEDDGVYEYQISGWDDQNEYDLDVDAESGDIVEEETDDDDDEEDTLTFDNIITPQEAMQAAVNAGNTDYVESWTLEVEDGTMVYDVDLENDDDDDDITVDAETGDVIDQ